MATSLWALVEERPVPGRGRQRLQELDADRGDRRRQGQGRSDALRCPRRRQTSHGEGWLGRLSRRHRSRQVPHSVSHRQVLACREGFASEEYGPENKPLLFDEYRRRLDVAGQAGLRRGSVPNGARRRPSEP